MLRTKAQASISRPFILHFSDPRSHWVFRKSQYYQGGMKCCLMACLHKCLMIYISPKNPTTFSIQICQNPKLQLVPTDSFYPAPPSLYDIAIARNPSNSVSPIRVSVSPSWPCQRSVTCCIYFGLTELCNRSHRVGLTNSLLPYCYTSVSPSWCSRRRRDEVCPKS